MANWFKLKPFNGESIAFSTSGAGITGYSHKKRMNLDHYLIPYII